MKTQNVYLTTFILFFLFASLISSPLKAENTNDNLVMDSLDIEQLYLIKKVNNLEYIGHILKDDGREVLIETEKLGKIYIPKADILSIQKIEDKKAIIREKYYDAGPFTTRYIFTTNALPINKGNNYARLNLYGPEVHFAISDHFSFGILTTWAVSPFMFSGKYSFTTKDPKLNFSVGTLLGTSGYINNMKTWGALHYGNITYGTPKDNITFGAGFGYVIPGVTKTEAPVGNYPNSASYYAAQTEQPVYPASGPVFSLSGITKVGSKASFVFDSMFALGYAKMTLISTVPHSGFDYAYTVQEKVDNFSAIILMPGMRFQTKENSAFQISLNTVKIFNAGDSSTDNSVSFPLPSCSWFFRF